MRSSLPCVLIAAVLVTACSVDTIVNKVNPYKIDVRQGNYVDQAMVSQLKKGMTRDQVRFVLGSPLVVDVFHKDRWDYVYRFKPGKAEAEQRIISVYFVDDRLDHVEGDVAAGDAQGAAAAQQERRSRVVDVPATESK